MLDPQDRCRFQPDTIKKPGIMVVIRYDEQNNLVGYRAQFASRLSSASLKGACAREKEHCMHAGCENASAQGRKRDTWLT